MENFISLDLPALISVVFSALACALIGNYLVLRKLSLMGDAISHSVLPGIVVAFLLTSSKSSFSVFIGAAVAGILSSILIEAVRKYGQVETGAAMGVVFSIFFAFGVVLIEQASARNMDLDADCLLHGQLESIFWYPNLDNFFSYENFLLLPTEVYSSIVTFLLIAFFVTLFYKELKISSFDSALANSLGFSSNLIYNILMVLVALCVVASFRVVGSILVIAMIICPAAIARFYTDKLLNQLLISLFVAFISCLSGYYLGGFAPIALGYDNSVSISGMITVVLGFFLYSSFLFAPSYGIVGRYLRQKKIGFDFVCNDILANLYRAEEKGESVEELPARNYLNSLSKSGLIQIKQDLIVLTSRGRSRASELIRSHRLWEKYLVDEAGIDSAHVHYTATVLQSIKEPKQIDADFDPHGKPIPKKYS